jgi:adenine deaminase
MIGEVYVEHADGQRTSTAVLLAGTRVVDCVSKQCAASAITANENMTCMQEQPTDKQDISSIWARTAYLAYRFIYLNNIQ